MTADDSILAAVRRCPSPPMNGRPATLADRYALTHLLGAGSFGEVWAARDAVTGAAVAVKLLRAPGRQSPDALRRFEREAAALAGFDHPRIVALRGRGVWEEAPFFVMELMPGGSALEWIRGHRDTGRWTPLATALRLFDDACEGVAAAHAWRPAAIVHRDLKAANLLLDAARARAKVADFGVARVREEALAGPKTATGAVLGSAHVMAPEQAAGRQSEVGPPTDVFSLGATLVELVTMRSLPAGRAWWQVVVRDGDAVERLLPTLRPDVPAGLWAVAARCLRARPEHRFPDAAALRAALRAAGIEAPERPGGASAPPTADLEGAPTDATVAAPRG